LTLADVPPGAPIAVSELPLQARGRQKTRFSVSAAATRDWRASAIFRLCLTASGGDAPAERKDSPMKTSEAFRFLEDAKRVACTTPRAKLSRDEPDAGNGTSGTVRWQTSPPTRHSAIRSSGLSF